MRIGKVAVLLSTYNGEKYIEDFLSGLRVQEWKEITLVVRDDGSSDNTLQIIRKACDFFKVKVLPSDGNLGSAKSFFSLLNEAGDDFDYYAFADQDDYWLPDKISRAVKTIETVSQDNPALYCSGVEYVDEHLNHLKWYTVPNKIGFGNALVENVATGCTIVLNKTARQLILSKLPDNCLMHDWWFYLVISCFGTILWDDYSGIKYRQHQNNTVGAATTFFGDMQRRLRRFFKKDKNGLFSLSAQAATFYKLFSHELPDDKKHILKLIIDGKSSFFRRILLMFSTEIWRQRLFDNVIMRAVILINRY